MKIKTLLLCLAFAVSVIPCAGQESVEDLEFESESITQPYRPKSRNYVYLRSKQGKGGLKTTNSADSITSIPITDIVLVYTEMSPADQADREKANGERWANLMQTYPEFFQYSSTYMNICQCNPRGDSAAFKKAQGFYIYYQSDDAAAEETPAEPPAPVAETPKPEEPKVTESRTAAKEAPAKEKEEPRRKKKEEPEDEPVVTSKNREEVKKKKEEAPSEPVTRNTERNTERRTEEPAEEAAETPEPPKPVAKAPAKKKPGANTIRKAKDPKACRPACYGYGDEDLAIFFKDNITLSKKQKRKGKNLMSSLTLQLNPDGTIKKAQVAGPNPDFNQQVQAAASAMQPWNAAVRNGVAVKSQVKINLKFDKASKTIKPSDVIVNPRPSPKCVCVSDEEIFGSN